MAEYKYNPYTNTIDVVIPGEKGDTGDTGPQGVQGDPGQGVSSGGTTGQLLAKASNGNFDTEWVNPPNPSWGFISGTLSNQTDLITALNGKQPLSLILTNTTASFTSLLETKLNGIAFGAEVNVNADWNAVSGDAQILNKPTIPTLTSQLTNDSGFLTTNAVSSVNSQTGIVVLDADDINDSSTTNKFVTSSDLTNLSNLSGINTGDQDLSSYWKSDGSESATGNWNLGINNFTIGGKIEIDKNYINFTNLPAPTTPSLALQGVSGLVPVGTNHYAITYVTALGETVRSATASISVPSAANAQVQVTFPVSVDPTVTARKIYRGGDSANMRPIVTINDNVTTTYIDNNANVTNVEQFLGGTTSGAFYQNGVKVMQIDTLGNLRLGGPDAALRVGKTTAGYGLISYNTVDEKEAVEFGGTRWSSNIFEVGTFARGGGLARKVRLKSSNASVSMNFDLERAGTDWASLIDSGTSIGGVSFVRFNPALWTATGGENRILTLGTVALNHTSAGGYSLFNIDATNGVGGSGSKFFSRYTLDGNTIHSINNVGDGVFAGKVTADEHLFTADLEYTDLDLNSSLPYRNLKLLIDTANYYRNIDFSSGWTFFNTTGFGGSQQTFMLGINGTNAAGGSSTARLSGNNDKRGRFGANRSSGGTWGSTDFASQILINVLISGVSGRTDFATDSFAVVFGDHVAYGITNSGLSQICESTTPLGNSNFFGFRILNGDVQIFVRFGVSGTFYSSVLTTLSNIYDIGSFVLYSNGLGVVSLYRNEVFLGSMSGAPNTFIGNPSSIAIGLETTATTNREVWIESLGLRCCY